MMCKRKCRLLAGCIQKNIKFFLGITLCIIGICLLYSISQNNSHANKNTTNICESPSCVIESVTLHNTMNIGENPCSDFYSYTCGKFVKRTKHMFSAINGPIDITQMLILEAKVTEKTIEALTTPILRNETSSDKLMKQFFQSCLDESCVDDNLYLLMETLTNLGDWPILPENKWQKKGKWHEIVKKLNEAGMQSDFPFEIKPWINESNSRVYAKLSPTSNLFPEKCYRDQYKKRCLNFIADIGSLVGLNEDVSWHEGERLLYFDYLIFKAGQYPGHDRTFSPDNVFPFNVVDLSQKYPGVPWNKYVAGTFHMAGIKVDQVEKVVTDNPFYLDKISHILQDDKKMFANYQNWRLIFLNLSLLPIRFRIVISEFERNLDMRTNFQEDHCFKMISTTVAIKKFYADKYIDDQKKKLIQEMWQAIKMQAAEYVSSFDRDFLERLPPGEKHYKSVVLDKLRNLSTKLSFPKQFSDDTGIIRDAYDKAFSRKQLCSLAILWTIKHAEIQIEMNNTYAKSMKEHFRFIFSHLMTKEVGYERLYNSILLYGGILQRPVFDIERPMYMNFGAVGFLMGHEIVRGLGLTNKTVEQCLEQQFSKHVLKTIKTTVNGTITLRENYADHLGIQLGYNAYKAWRDKTKAAEPSLPNFSSKTPEQMFWIAAASIWCEYNSKERLIEIVKKDDHPPSVARINEGFKNLPMFVEDFNCPLGSKMNPVNKCY